MRLYLAAAYSRREELCAYRDELLAAGIEVGAAWLDGPNQRHIDGLVLDAETEAEIETRKFDTARARWYAKRCAEQDVADILQADGLVMFTGGGRGGGRHVEVGVALASGMQVMLVGPRENVFHCLGGVVHFDEWEEARAFLGATVSEVSA